MYGTKKKGKEFETPRLGYGSGDTFWNDEWLFCDYEVE